MVRILNEKEGTQHRSIECMQVAPTFFASLRDSPANLTGDFHAASAEYPGHSSAETTLKFRCTLASMSPNEIKIGDVLVQHVEGMPL